MLGDDFVDEAVLHGFVCAHEVVAFSVGFNGFCWLAGVFGEDLVELVLGFEDAFGVDLNVCCLSLHAAQDLVDHDLRVWKGEAFAFGAACEKNSSHGGCHADTDGGYVWFDVLHCIIDGEACCDGSTRRVDVDLDVFGFVFALEEEELCYHDVCDLIVDLGAEHDDAIFEETRVDIVGSFAHVGFFDNGWDEPVFWIDVGKGVGICHRVKEYRG